MDDWARKIISFRQQEEAGWHSLPAGPGRKTCPAFAEWAVAIGKQRKILFVQAVFLRGTPTRPGRGFRPGGASAQRKPPIAGNPVNYALRRNHASAKLAQGFGRIGAAVPLLMESASRPDEALSE
jgi:hypothetical protein